jgi:hypothetical protein
VASNVTALRYSKVRSHQRPYMLSSFMSGARPPRPAPVNDHDHRPKTLRISSSNAFCAVRPRTVSMEVTWVPEDRMSL